MEYWEAIVRNFATSALPQSIAGLYFSLMFWGDRLRKPLQSILWFSFIGSAYISITMVFLPAAARPLNSVASLLVLSHIWFRELPGLDRAKHAATCIFMFAATEIAASYLLILLRLETFETLSARPAGIPEVLLPWSAAAGALAYAMDRYAVHPGRRIIGYIRRPENRALLLLMVLLTGQIVLSSLVFLLANQNNRVGAAFGVFVISLSSFATVLLALRSMSATRQKAILTTQETYIDEINHLFTTVRGQRHDFINHVQVIQQLVNRGKIEDLKRYTAELVGEIKDINDLLQIGHPAFAALVKSKLVRALDMNVEFHYLFEGLERIRQDIASVDYVKIAGNLIDNALDEVKDRPPDERWMEMVCWTDDKHLHMTVSNPSRPMSEPEKLKLFQPGYTTKPDASDRGLGLSIVRDRVTHYRGEIYIDMSAELIVSFRIRLPIARRAVVQ